MYQNSPSEAIAGRRDRVQLSVKFDECHRAVVRGQDCERHRAQGRQGQRSAPSRSPAPRSTLAASRLVRLRLRHEIKTLQRRLGVTTIMVTHDQEEALTMADRIVVMNHGVIEQVGTPMEIYREPASPFVADFVGKVNMLPGHVAGGQLQLGQLSVPHAAPDGSVKVYLRPEDVLARPIAAGDALVFDSRIEQIDFLGSFCHVHVSAPALGGQPLIVYQIGRAHV